MWPSEGSVSEEALDLVISKGIDWIAADEDILFRTISLSDRRITYQPYKLKRDSKTINIVFRDKNLSDMISFTYNSWDEVKAAEDLLGHFKRILENLRRDADRALVTIVMDGENAWEYYADNGRAFFERLYSNLDGKEGSIGSTTVSEYLEAEPQRKTITNIFPGSWINHNFEIWIGEEQDNMSWEYLERTRRDLERFTKEADKRSGAGVSNIKAAWREFYIAEGSDWNLWYSGKAHAGKDNSFDKLYRIHLKNVYKFLKVPIPD